MSRNLGPKTETRIDESAQAVILILAGFEKRNPGEWITKPVLYPMVTTRVEEKIEDNLTLYLDAITAPDEAFLTNHWSLICKAAARKYKKYIVWGSKGCRLGTLEEYEENQNDLAAIGRGICDAVGDRTHIIQDNGGQSFFLEQQAYLPSGPTDKDNGE